MTQPERDSSYVGAPAKQLGKNSFEQHSGNAESGAPSEHFGGGGLLSK